MDDYRDNAADFCPTVPDFSVPPIPDFSIPSFPRKRESHSACPPENGDWGRRRADCGRLSRCSLLSMLGARGSGRRRDSPPHLRRAEREMAGAVIPSTASGRPMDEQCGGARAIGRSEIRRKTVRGCGSEGGTLNRFVTHRSRRGAIRWGSLGIRNPPQNDQWDAYRASAAPAGGHFDPLQISRRLRNLRKSMFCKRRADCARTLVPHSSLCSLKIAKGQFSHHLAMLATNKMSASAAMQTAASIGA